VAVIIGVALGVGGYTFVYARGADYLGSDPASCANCHVMREQYDGWQRASHRDVAVCNDCHAPHTFFGKWFTKALNGFNHSRAFTTGNFHEPIRITKRNRDITQGACRHCHQEVVQMIDFGDEQVDCIRCHRDVGHGH
jgi:cytochrome c nitrite reductase small subunit